MVQQLFLLQHSPIINWKIDNMEQQHIKTNAQIIARCTFNKATGKVEYESFAEYYPTLRKKIIFK